MTVRTVRTTKVVAAQKVAAKHGGCWATWALSCHPGFRPAESPQCSFRRWLASISLALRERERGGTRHTRLLHTNESVPSTTAAQTDNKTRLTYSFGNSPSMKQHKRLFCWHTTTGGSDPLFHFRLGTRKSGLGSPVAQRRRRRWHREGSACRGWANGMGGM